MNVTTLQIRSRTVVDRLVRHGQATARGIKRSIVSQIERSWDVDSSEPEIDPDLVRLFDSRRN